MKLNTGNLAASDTLRLTFQKGDFIAIILVAVLAAAVGVAFWPGKIEAQQTAVQIYQDGELIRELPLDTDAAMEIIGDYTNTVTIKDGKAAITASDCPGMDCVHTGWISGAGRSIVCLPNRVEIRITGLTEVDFVVG